MSGAKMESVKMLRTPTSRKPQRGVTLVEVLVTVVVISVGLLGVAALHTLSLRNGQDAHLRSQATALSHDILDRMRANRLVAITTNSYDIAIGTPAAVVASPTLAQTDLRTWKTALLNALPSGDGAVARSTVAGQTVFTITIQWGEHGNNMTFTTQAEL